jgi:hypothetical protein
VKVILELAMATEVLQGINFTHDRVQSLSEQGILEIPTSYIRPAGERPAVQHSAHRDIPVIDLAEGGPHISEEVGEACRVWGFFQVNPPPLYLFIFIFLDSPQHVITQK